MISTVVGMDTLNYAQKETFVFSFIVNLIAKNLCKPVEDVHLNYNTTLNELGIDSLDCLELIIEVEDNFDITIMNGHEINTVGKLVNVVVGEIEK